MFRSDSEQLVVGPAFRELVHVGLARSGLEDRGDRVGAAEFVYNSLLSAFLDM